MKNFRHQLKPSEHAAHVAALCDKRDASRAALLAAQERGRVADVARRGMLEADGVS